MPVPRSRSEREQCLPLFPFVRRVMTRCAEGAPLCRRAEKMLHGEQICSSVPYRQVAISLFHCSAHQAWEFHSLDATWHNDDHAEIDWQNDVYFGPFDSERDVVAAVLADLMIRLPLAAASG